MREPSLEKLIELHTFTVSILKVASLLVAVFLTSLSIVPFMTILILAAQSSNPLP